MTASCSSDNPIGRAIAGASCIRRRAVSPRDRRAAARHRPSPEIRSRVRRRHRRRYPTDARSGPRASASDRASGPTSKSWPPAPPELPPGRLVHIHVLNDPITRNGADDGGGGDRCAVHEPDRHRAGIGVAPQQVGKAVGIEVAAFDDRPIGWNGA